MQSVQADENSLFKLAQLWHFMKTTNNFDTTYPKLYSKHRIIKAILDDKDLNVNRKVTIHSDGRTEANVHLKDCTALHFTYYKGLFIAVFNTLLKRGADFTAKNANGQTVVHLILSQRDDIKEKFRYINLVMSAHVQFRQSVNPRDNYGFSHLHGAYLANHVEALELFLEAGASIDETVNLDAPNEYAGYTPLHFAAVQGSFQVAKILVSRGANVNARSKNGKNPLDLLVNDFAIVSTSEKEQTVKLLLESNGVSALGLSTLQLACALDDLTIAERLLAQGADVDYTVPMKSPHFPGYTALHFAAIYSFEAVKLLSIRGADIEIANASGRSPLDNCIIIYSQQEVREILSCNENWKEILLSDGQSRLLDLIEAMMSDLEKFKLYLQDKVKDITDVVVPRDSKLCPGYTLLHLAVTLAKFTVEDNTVHFDQVIVEECLNRGLSVNVQDVKGRTPIHLAFCREQANLVSLLLARLEGLEKVPNVVDEDNLSYLHIACALKNELLVEKFLAENSESANIAYRGKPINNACGSVESGTTPLHVVVANEAHRIADLLLKYGADVHAANESGFTPIHMLLDPDHLTLADNPIVNVLFDSLLANDPQDRIVDGLGLSYLHVACFLGNVEVVKKLLDLGSDVNAFVQFDKHSDSFLSKTTRAFRRSYANYTPLVMILETYIPMDVRLAVIDLLLQGGADIFANESNASLGNTTLRMIPVKCNVVVRRYCQLLWDREDLQKHWDERFGLTKLHIACYLKNEDAVRCTLSSDAIDVNSPVRADSAIFASCTPLHLLMMMTGFGSAVGNIINLLLDRGAEVTITNANKETPIHVLYAHRYGFREIYHCLDLLLNAQRDFRDNPTNAQGLSHFHLACMGQKLGIVEKFLQHGSVDVNQTIDYFAQNNAGCTPLHSTLNESIELYRDRREVPQVVDLLLKYGANVAAVDVLGDTPLHKPCALYSSEVNILDKLIDYGGNINSENVQGKTPIEMWLHVNNYSEANLSSLYLELLRKYDCKINSWNRFSGEGRIAQILASSQPTDKLHERLEFDEFIKSSDAQIDNHGRTAIHNSVALLKMYSSEGLENTVESLIKIGIDIDHQDTSGQTALHYTARMDNVPCMRTLLLCGTDINIVDNRGKSAFSYAIENLIKNKNHTFYWPSEYATEVLCWHIEQLEHLRIEVSQLNRNLVKQLRQLIDCQFYKAIILPDEDSIKLSADEFYSQVEMTKTLKTGTNLPSLFDFLSETGAVNSYCFLTKFEQDKVDDFFKSLDVKELGKISGIIKLQFRKMTARLKLIDAALDSLRTLLGFSFPGLCEQISRFLLNTDLRNLIESTTL